MGVLIGGLLGFLTTYVTAVYKFRKELEAEWDKEIRKQRMRTYPQLMRCLDVLARYDRPLPLNAETLANLSVSMRKWFFEVGGILLSDGTRKSYFDLKEGLSVTVSALRKSGDKPIEPE